MASSWTRRRCCARSTRWSRPGIKVDQRLLISDRAHLILPYHRTYEVAAEQIRCGGKIGTTAKGIGPAYEDKAARRGLRLGDLRNPEEFRRKASSVLAEKNRIVAALCEGCPQAEQETIERTLATAPRIVPLLIDCSLFLNGEMDRGKRVLFEGAQGTLLDLDHGTYPFVTSSSAAAGGACTGTGVGPPESAPSWGSPKLMLRASAAGHSPRRPPGLWRRNCGARGGEYGAVTGRPRRCGWFDVPIARYSVRVNGLSAFIITKLDILDHLAEIPVGVEYEYKGKRFADFPADIETLEKVKVHYKLVPGWQEPTFGLREYSRLPQKARDYLRFLSDQAGVEIAMVSTGPERDQVIWLEESRLAKELRP